MEINLVNETAQWVTMVIMTIYLFKGFKALTLTITACEKLFEQNQSINKMYSYLNELIKHAIRSTDKEK